MAETSSLHGSNKLQAFWLMHAGGRVWKCNIINVYIDYDGPTHDTRIVYARHCNASTNTHACNAHQLPAMLLTGILMATMLQSTCNCINAPRRWQTLLGTEEHSTLMLEQTNSKQLCYLNERNCKIKVAP